MIYIGCQDAGEFHPFVSLSDTSYARWGVAESFEAIIQLARETDSGIFQYIFELELGTLGFHRRWRWRGTRGYVEWND